jgi:hypothetical protein
VLREVAERPGHNEVIPMSKYVEYGIVIVAIALLIPACGSKEASDRGSSARAEPVASQGNHQAVRLSGCVELSGMASYILQRVHVEDRTGQDPHRTTNHPGGGIIEGSWVRLSGTRDLRALAGHRVVVSGVLVDPDQRAVGTGGVAGVILPSGDVSRASANEFYWTKVKKEAGPIARSSIAAGAGPEIQVTEIKDLGEGCHER